MLPTLQSYKTKYFLINIYDQNIDAEVKLEHTEFVMLLNIRELKLLKKEIIAERLVSNIEILECNSIGVEYPLRLKDDSLCLWL